MTPEERASRLIDENKCFYDSGDCKEPSVAFKRSEGEAAIAAAIRQAVEEERASAIKFLSNQSIIDFQNMPERSRAIAWACAQLKAGKHIESKKKKS